MKIPGRHPHLHTHPLHYFLWLMPLSKSESGLKELQSPVTFTLIKS